MSDKPKLLTRSGYTSFHRGPIRLRFSFHLPDEQTATPLDDALPTSLIAIVGGAMASWPFTSTAT